MYQTPKILKLKNKDNEKKTWEKNITMVLADASSSGTLSNNALLTALWYYKKEC